MEKNMQIGWLIEMIWEGKPSWWSVGEDENGYRPAGWTADRQLAFMYPTYEEAAESAWDLGIDDVEMVEV